MNILVTGASGFIGFHLCKKLVNKNIDVVGIDNINDYYDVNLKLDRLKELGINTNLENTEIAKSNIHNNFKFKKIDINHKDLIDNLFNENSFDIVVHLAAQAGVRYSLENPYAYIESNISGFLNILEASKKFKIKHLIYASSSSVYGNNKEIPFRISQNVDNPISLYAATKKSNELMAHVYSHLYNLKTTGLRFFTVYGPWGRPDMAYYLFVSAITKGDPIKVFNNGLLSRDFTYIDDIVEGLFRVIKKDISNRDSFKLYNIGNSKTEKLVDFINLIEKNLGLNAKKILLPKQPGDVDRTWADNKNFYKDYNYKPKVDLAKGIKNFVLWYNNYYQSESK